ncbi:transporter substrate-binding domain-containing protein [Mycobacterium yunnanensis]|uniref:Transporter substrate-binding domain-containing protein n=1 Tax=Mycobacterium yunnanensis TaxID=368477 RepID=A0A9X2Z7U4_9MYCO|nr:transporter substrate-binding domain-containing protein [Mycobacterium yunnanensis]MCV7424548.1 transporter substrate-binding domain-containing protein [Mycobacterium yunnanensis]
MATPCRPRRRILAAVAAVGTAVVAAGCGSAPAAPGIRTLQTGVLSVCLYPGFAPFSERDHDGAFVGWDVAYLTEFAAKEKLRVRPVEVTKFDGIWLAPANDTCDIAASGISDDSDRRAETGTGATWSAHYYNVLRAFVVRSADDRSVSGVEDLRNRTVIVTANSTADADLRNRLLRSGITTTTIRGTSNEEDAARQVRDATPGGEPFAYGGGLGSLQLLVKRLGGLSVVWPHCNMRADGSQVEEPFSFVVRGRSTGLADALNAFIAKPGTTYPGASAVDAACAPLPPS